MKKLLSVILSASMFLMSGICAFAEMPGALTKLYTNYTANQTVTLSLKNADDFIAFLDEVEINDTLEKYIDMKMLIESLFTNSTQMNIQADISNNFEKILVGITADSAQKFDLNPNLKMDINSKMGMWLDLDISGDEPVCKLIYQQPYRNKYAVIDMMQAPLEEEERAEMLSVFKNILNKEFLQSINRKSIEIIQKYADTGFKGKYYCIDIDNSAFINIANEFNAYINEIIQTEESVVTIPEGFEILGKEGISVKYSIFNNNISNAQISADFCIDLSKISEVIYEEAWEYQSRGIINFELESEAKYSDISKTKVEFPEITEENSVDLVKELAAEPVPEDTETLEYEENRTYPNLWASDYFSYVYTEGEEVYVPVRSAMVAAYEEQVDISYESGIITLSSEYFPGFKQLVIKLGGETAYADGTAVNIGKIIFKDDTTYIRAKAIEEIFDWELVDASYNFIYNEYSYTFYTKNEQIEMY